MYSIQAPASAMRHSSAVSQPSNKHTCPTPRHASMLLPPCPRLRHTAPSASGISRQTELQARWDRRSESAAWRTKAAAADGAGAEPVATPLGDVVKARLQMWGGLGALFVADKALKTACVANGITFPSSLIGMFGVFVLLCLVGDKAATKISSFFNPTLNWIARWLPLWYVASLVTLPLALSTMPAGDIAKLVGILTVGMAATLLFTGGTAVFIRNALKTEMKEVTKAKPSPPFALSHYVAWGTIAVVSLVGSFINPTTWGPELALPFNVACTVGGYLLGCLVPKNLHGVLHPVVVCAVLANAGAALHGSIVGWSYSASLKAYLAKGAGPMGAGDLLMSFLGMVIISFGFKVYAQRDTMRRHAPEIMGACILSSLFSMFSTAFMAKALALPSDLSRAIIPRSVTVALALPIATQLDAPLAITAAAVLLQGLLGANFGPDLMTKFGIKDTIARGLAAAATAGGLGTASLTSREPEALPFCALSYSMIGILSTVFASIPFVREALIAIVG